MAKKPSTLKYKKQYRVNPGTLQEKVFDNLAQLDDDLFAVALNDKHGMINSAGEIVVPLIYDTTDASIPFTRFGQDAYITRLNGKMGIINSRNEILFPFLYQNIEPYNFFTKSYQSHERLFKEHSLVVIWDSSNGHYGLAKAPSGEFLVQPELQEIIWSDYGFDVKKNWLWGVMDFQGQIIVDYIYHNRVSLTYDYNMVKGPSGDTLFLNRQGEPIHRERSQFCERYGKSQNAFVVLAGTKFDAGTESEICKLIVLDKEPTTGVELVHWYQYYIERYASESNADRNWTELIPEREIPEQKRILIRY